MLREIQEKTENTEIRKKRDTKGEKQIYKEQSRGNLLRARGKGGNMV